MKSKHFFLSNGIKCYVGKNKEDNWNLLDYAFKTNMSWIFFHLSSFSSPYLILEADYEFTDNETIAEAAEILKRNTKYSNLKNIYIDYTILSNVKKTDTVGEIEYKSLRKVNRIRT